MCVTGMTTTAMVKWWASLTKECIAIKHQWLPNKNVNASAFFFFFLNVMANFLSFLTLFSSREKENLQRVGVWEIEERKDEWDMLQGQSEMSTTNVHIISL